MSNHSHEMEAPRGQFLVYQAEDGNLKLDVRFEDESVWLTQQLMAELFQSSKQNVSHHINAIYEERELTPEATVKKYLTVRIEKTLGIDLLSGKGVRSGCTVFRSFRVFSLPVGQIMAR